MSYTFGIVEYYVKIKLLSNLFTGNTWDSSQWEHHSNNNSNSNRTSNINRWYMILRFALQIDIVTNENRNSFNCMVTWTVSILNLTTSFDRLQNLLFVVDGFRCDGGWHDSSRKEKSIGGNGRRYECSTANETLRK